MNRREWTAEEIERMRAEYPVTRSTVLAESMGRSLLAEQCREYAGWLESVYENEGQRG